ncbi:iron transporter [Novosphingobium guangzhouense]|uniref:Iron transporter n=1 Tax=Novosphingobium guangzhouense TaxID=1850347 RepID=A0A2K2FTM5_9SPHN|nr:iron transporter [Novosphingobium guangzhouense]PNU02132.1 iron transporter [Novosphingobium guangzhouense]
MSRGKAVPAGYRWAVASRVAGAFIGGYALTSAATVLLALVWPLPKAQAVLSASMASFALYAGFVIWAFHVRRLRWIWGVVLGGTALLSAAAWMLDAGGAA